MTENTQLKIEAIDDKSPHLKTVIALGRANKATLGLFPDEAFAGHAARRQILVALTPEEKCIGYLLYRSVRRDNIIVIVHLCVEPSWRGRGVARMLVNHLSLNTQEYYGIKLKCRCDYEIDGMWSKLDFLPLNEKPGRSRDGTLLTVWWLDHGHPTLFSMAATQQLESTLCAVIDTSVFFDLHGDEDIESEESESLLADWLQSDLKLCITDEIFNEIKHIDDPEHRSRKRQFADTFTRLPCPSQSFERALHSINLFLKDRKTDIDEYEIRQLARTIASEAPVFVTRSQDIIALSDEIYENFQLAVISPAALIVQLDEVRRKTDYQPVRLAGTLIQIQLVHRSQEPILTDHFNAEDQGEKKRDFQRRLRQILANPDKFKCYVVLERENEPLALIAYGRQKSHELEIPMLRVRYGSLTATLARHLIFRSISLSACENRQFTRITDPYLEETVVRAIQENAFVRVSNGYVKPNIAIAETAVQLSRRLTNLADYLGQEYNFCLKIAEILKADNLIRDVETTAELERHLWPSKIIDADIPTFIIPIQPRWAKDLFDEELANQYLFGAKTELALNREAVYYRAGKKLRGLRTPGRILWYVSNDDNYRYVSSIRACSRIDEVVIGKPKDLFLRFRRLGVYEWKDIFELAGNNINNDIIAIKFSQTELFNNPVPLNTIQKILNNKTTIPSLFRLSINTNEPFEMIYKLGTKT